ncbi:MAG: single-stranded DNA-binding protein [Acidimicrobiia bacterium]|nr:single-stranded DNA-binding protein [Acidimicrobiia bacterium]
MSRAPQEGSPMDLNLTILGGHLAAAPELRTFASGTRCLRLLVTVRSTTPRRRVDVVPVTWWDPTDDDLEADLAPGQGVWVAGSVQRRFWASDDGRRSRIEVIAHDVQFRDPDHIGTGEPAAAI